MVIGMTRNVAIVQEENWYIATDIVSGVASQGKTIEDALSNLKEALELYYEDDQESLAASGSTKVFITTLELENAI